MSGAYPQFQSSCSHEELVEHFLLTPADLQLVLACRGEANRCGKALLMKALTYLGYVPDGLDQIPREVRTFVAGQLGLLWGHSTPSPGHRRTVSFRQTCLGFQEQSPEHVRSAGLPRNSY
jgi:hypothetical protein